jgi:protein-disulfide isomerase
MSTNRKKTLLSIAVFAAAWMAAGATARTGAPLRPGRTHMVTRSASATYPTLGPRHAPVTIWLWSSFRLYHMQGIGAKLKEVMKQFPGRVRVVGLHRSRNYGDEDIISQIAREAFAQGGSPLYWKVHTALTTVQNIYRLNALKARKLAIQAGVNGTRLARALKAETHKDTIYNETMRLMELGGSSTSYNVLMLINTQMYQMRRYYRARNIAYMVKQELAKAQRAMKSGVPLSKVAQWALKKAKRRARFRTYPYYRYRYYRYRRFPSALTMRKLGVGTKAPVRRYHVPVQGAPMRGNPLAVVTAVFFVDLRNYYSQLAYKEMLKLQARFKNRMRLVVRMLPTATDRHADWAARLAISAHKLGKFWEMVDEMIKSRYVYPNRLKQMAQKTGLELEALKVQLKSQEVRDQLNRDRRLAARLGVYTAPVIFINGRKIRSITSSYARFFVDAVVRDELRPGVLSRFLGDREKRSPLP